MIGLRGELGKVGVRGQKPKVKVLFSKHIYSVPHFSYRAGCAMRVLWTRVFPAGAPAHSHFNMELSVKSTPTQLDLAQLQGSWGFPPMGLSSVSTR